MELLFEGIKKTNRHDFKMGIKKISDKFSAYFDGEKVCILYPEPDVVTNETLIEKCRAKKQLKIFVEEFILWQFKKS